MAGPSRRQQRRCRHVLLFLRRRRAPPARLSRARHRRLPPPLPARWALGGRVRRGGTELLQQLRVAAARREEAACKG